jgi:HD superfamily phosphodiesterase
MKIKPVYQKIYQLAKPYLGIRHNDIHTEICLRFGYRLMAAEGGNERIVIPAIILHDVGWKKVPEQLHLKAFGPKATMPELTRLHEAEGVKIAKNILDQVNYDAEEIIRILEIIDGHDTRKQAISLNDQVVKDADKLWRYSKKGFCIDIKRFGESYMQGLNRLRKNLPVCFLTKTARALAGKELQKREREPVP